MTDLWAKGKDIAVNPSASRKIRNSPMGFSLRDGFRKPKATAAKVAVGAAKRLVKAIPIVGDEVSSLVEAMAKFGRDRHINNEFSKIAKTQQERAEETKQKIKWGWKKQDVAKFDRFRTKVINSRRELDDIVSKYNSSVATLSPCDDFLKITTAYAYHENRINKFRDELFALTMLVETTNTWLDQNMTNLEKWKKIQDEALKQERGQKVVNHAECSSSICDVMRQRGHDTNWRKLGRSLNKIDNAIGHNEYLVKGAGIVAGLGVSVADNRASGDVTGRIK